MALGPKSDAEVTKRISAHFGKCVMNEKPQLDDIGFQKAKALLAEMRKDVELTMRNNQVGKNLLVVGICKEKLSRIDEILNWKEGV